MAVTNVHPIRTTLSKAIAYIMNPDNDMAHQSAKGQ